jgi:integrase
MQKRLTEKSIQQLAIRHEPYTVWDRVTVGLAIRVTPSHSKIWVLQTVYPGATTAARRTLGKYPDLGVTAARDKAQRWRTWVKEGIDPAEAEEAERERQAVERRAEAIKRANTFAAVAAAYIAGRSNRRAKPDAREINRMLVTAWGDKPIHKIEPRDVRELLDKIKMRAPYDARNAWGHAVGIFKQAVHDELIKVSPCASLDKKLVFKNVKLQSRQRVLNDREIAALWRASERLGPPYGQLYQMLLLTGCRLNEVAQARWSEVHPDLKRILNTRKPVDWSAVSDDVKVWIVPRERFKSDVEHRVPLTDDALRILETLPRFADCDWLFTVGGKGPVQGFSKIKKQIDGLMRKALKADEKLAPWVNHDLRRTLRSNLSALKVSSVVAEASLGHGRKGIERIYDVHEYLPEQRAALVLWAGKVRSIVGPDPSEPPDSKIVPLKQRVR